jgi:hypothetical protein
MTTSFAHVDLPAVHPGVQRAERVAGALRGFAHTFDGARAAATMLLAAMVAALLVVANQVVETWTEGHLLAAWIVMWTVAFAAIALFAAPARRVHRRVGAALREWNLARRQRAVDDELWRIALEDARVMADISRAMDQAARDVKAYY